MKEAADFAEAIRRISALIQPKLESWPTSWRLTYSTPSIHTLQRTLDQRADHRLLISLHSSGLGSSWSDELCRLLVRVALLGRHWINPADCLVWINQSLLSLGFDPPLIGLTVLLLDPETGVIELARAGHPPVLILDSTNHLELLTGPAPFLGVCEVTYTAQTCQVASGSRLIMASHGRPDLVAAAVERRADLVGQAFAEAVAADLFTQTNHPEGVAVVVLEHLAALRMAG